MKESASMPPPTPGGTRDTGDGAEKLQRLQREVQAANKRLVDLYELAPVAYVSLDDDGYIRETNVMGAHLLQSARANLLGKPFVHFVSRDDIDSFLQHLRDCRQSQDRVSTVVRLSTRDRHIVHTQLISMPAEYDTQQRLLYRTVINDISDRVVAEEQLKASLFEKEVLLKELHHRVKNNLQVISSILKLQSGYVKDPQASQSLQETQNIVRAIALIHESLYRTQNFQNIDFGEHVRTLTTNLFRSYGANVGPVELILDIDEVRFDIDTALPCSLIINELVSNALKHAFPSGRTGEVRIRLQGGKDKRYTLEVSDNGVGIPAGVDLENSDSLGLQVVSALAGELDATVEFSGGDGTLVRLSFIVPEPLQKARS